LDKDGSKEKENQEWVKTSMLKKIKVWDGDKLDDIDIRTMTVYHLYNAQIRCTQVAPENSTSPFILQQDLLILTKYFKCTLYGRALNTLPFKIPFQKPVILSHTTKGIGT